MDKPQNIKNPIKYRYPSKRNNYKKYQYADWDWNDVLVEINETREIIEKGYMKYISNKYNINYNTLKQKYEKWNKDGNITISENRGGHNRLLTENQEKDLYDYITNVFIDCNLVFNNEHLKLLVKMKLLLIEYEYDKNKEEYKNKSIHELIKSSDINISDKWVINFKKRWRLSSLKTKYSRKAAKYDENEVVAFLTKCSYVYKVSSVKYIFNMDETFWRVDTGYDQVIGITGSCYRKVITDSNMKKGFTAVFVISSGGLFLKPLIILKGKTKKSLNKIKDVSDNDIIKTTSHSGWISINVMEILFDEIYQVTNGRKTVLILDQYSVHMDDIVKNKAYEYNIEMLYVPVGTTSKYQPLDVSINGPIKSIGKRLSNEIYMKDPFSKVTLVDSIKSLIQAKSQIKRDTVINSFKLALGI
jgi:transposase